MLSVIIPMYNSEKYIEECIESVVNQSFKNIEVIIVDDGSDDDSLILSKKYEKTDARVRVISKTHSGPFDTRALGVENAKGNYITFVDADDFIAGNSFELAKRDMESGVDVISFAINRYYDDKSILYDVDNYKEGIYSRKDMRKYILPNMIWDKSKNEFGLDPSLCTKIFKKSLIKDVYNKIGNVDFHYGEDVSVVYPVMKSANSVSIYKSAYYYHRLRKNEILPPYIRDIGYLKKLFELYMCLCKNMEDDLYREQIELFYVDSVQLVKKRYGLSISDYNPFVFPFDKVSKGDRVIIYGAGCAGKEYVNQIKTTSYCEIVLWTDINYEKMSDDVDSPEKISNTEFDWIVVAIMNIALRGNVVESLLERGVSIEKII